MPVEKGFAVRRVLFYLSGFRLSVFNAVAVGVREDDVFGPKAIDKLTVSILIDLESCVGPSS